MHDMSKPWHGGLSTESRLQEAVKEAIQQAFLRPNDAADRLCISRFADLETELTEYVLPAVMHQEQEDHGVYIDSVLQHLIPQWHLPNGPAQVSTFYHSQMADLRRAANMQLSRSCFLHNASIKQFQASLAMIRQHSLSKTFSAFPIQLAFLAVWLQGVRALICSHAAHWPLLVKFKVKSV